MDEQSRIAINLLGTDLANSQISAAISRAAAIRVIQAFDALNIESWTITTDMPVETEVDGDLPPGLSKPMVTGPEGWALPPSETNRLRLLFGLIQDLR